MSQTKAFKFKQTVETIQREIENSLHVKLDHSQKEMFQSYLISKIAMTYNDGYGDGLEKARQILLPPR
jgi:hypothetical protein